MSDQNPFDSMIGRNGAAAGQDATTTAQLVDDLRASFQGLHDTLKTFIGALKRLERHAARTAGERPVIIHNPRPVDTAGRAGQTRPRQACRLTQQDQTRLSAGRGVAAAREL